MKTKKLLFLVLFSLFTANAFPSAALKNYTLKDQNGKALQLHDLKGSFVLVSFVYTRCPMAEMCPLTMTLNKQVYSQWQKNFSSIPLKFLIVTLDPANDTPQVMKSYGKKFGVSNQAFVLATGEEQVVADFSAEFNAIGFPTNGLISHNSRSVLVSPDLIPLKDYKDNEWKPETLLKDLLEFSSKSQKKS